jgi:hypothetical protein
VDKALDSYVLLLFCLASLYYYLYWDWDLKYERSEIDRQFGLNVNAYVGRGGAGWVFLICLFFLLLRLLGLY